MSSVYSFRPRKMCSIERQETDSLHSFGSHVLGEPRWSVDSRSSSCGSLHSCGFRGDSCWSSRFVGQPRFVGYRPGSQFDGCCLSRSHSRFDDSPVRPHLGGYPGGPHGLGDESVHGSRAAKPRTEADSFHDGLAGGWKSGSCGSLLGFHGWKLGCHGGLRIGFPGSPEWHRFCG